VTSRGQLYELDFRLRPNGRKSPICISFDTFKKYYAEKGEVWEKLFLSKAKVVAETKEFTGKVKKVITDFVFAKIKTTELKKETVLMRNKIAEAVMTKQADKQKYQLYFKKWFGGLIDIEFLAEFLTILYGIKNKKIRKQNTISMLKALKKYQYISDEDYHLLSGAYLFLRNVENILRLINNYSVECLPEEDSEFTLLLLRLKIDGKTKDDFFQKYYEVTFTIREIYFRYLGEDKR